jgi:hypothetical protein
LDQERERKGKMPEAPVDRRTERVVRKWRPKGSKAGPSAPIQVIYLPEEFGASHANQYWEEIEEDGPSAELLLPPPPAVFEKPTESALKHMRPLYLRGHVDGKPMSKLLVDGGAAVNVMPYSTFRKIGKTEGDLIKTNMMLRDYTGSPTEAKGAINVELTVGSKTLPTTFFVIDSRGSYTLLLGRDWIHANCCVPSTLHQHLIQWDGDDVEVVPADKTIDVATTDLPLWESARAECLSGRVWEAEYIKVTRMGIELISTAPEETDG